MQIGGIWSVPSRSNPLLYRFISVFRSFQSVMKIYPFSFSSHLKQADCLNKIDYFFIPPFLHSPFSSLFFPLPTLFYASKKDLKHFRTLSPYSSLFLPASFRGIVRRFWLGGNQFLLSPPQISAHFLTQNRLKPSSLSSVSCSAYTRIPAQALYFEIKKRPKALLYFRSLWHYSVDFMGGGWAILNEGVSQSLKLFLFLL